MSSSDYNGRYTGLYNLFPGQLFDAIGAQLFVPTRVYLLTGINDDHFRRF